MERPILIETAKLLIEKTQATSLDSILEIEQANAKFIGQSTKEQHEQIIDNPAKGHLTIRKKEDRKIIGYTILEGVQSKNKSLLIKRIAIAEKGKGYGRESLQGMKKYCFELLQFHRLWLDVFDYNSRAIHLYETEGFQREGVMRECVLQNGTYHNLIVLSLLEQEYFKK